MMHNNWVFLGIAIYLSLFSISVAVFALWRIKRSRLRAPLEFKLLSAFVKNRGRVLSRDRLLDLVWGAGTYVTQRVIDNYIVTLRKKLEPEPAVPRFLVNVRGQGYRFDG